LEHNAFPRYFDQTIMGQVSPLGHHWPRGEHWCQNTPPPFAFGLRRPSTSGRYSLFHHNLIISL